METPFPATFSETPTIEKTEEILVSSLLQRYSADRSESHERPTIPSKLSIRTLPRVRHRKKMDETS
jgi:hypothetical protein